MGELVETLLADERARAGRMEQALNQIRTAFAPSARSPLALESVTVNLPSEWSLAAGEIAWHGARPSDSEPLRAGADAGRSRVDVTIHLCTICRRLYPSA
jgi:hypothetical protein